MWMSNSGKKADHWECSHCKSKYKYHKLHAGVAVYYCPNFCGKYSYVYLDECGHKKTICAKYKTTVRYQCIECGELVGNAISKKKVSVEKLPLAEELFKRFGNREHKEKKRERFMARYREKHEEITKRETGLCSITAKKVESVIKTIEERQIDVTANYEAWFKIGIALVEEFGESGLPYFHRISKFYPHYSSDECNYMYYYWLKNRSNHKITIGTFFYYTKKHIKDG